MISDNEYAKPKYNACCIKYDTGFATIHFIASIGVEPMTSVLLTPHYSPGIMPRSQGKGNTFGIFNQVGILYKYALMFTDDTAICSQRVEAGRSDLGQVEVCSEEKINKKFNHVKGKPKGAEVVHMDEFKYLNHPKQQQVRVGGDRRQR